MARMAIMATPKLKLGKKNEARGGGVITNQLLLKRFFLEVGPRGWPWWPWWPRAKSAESLGRRRVANPTCPHGEDDA